MNRTTTSRSEAKHGDAIEVRPAREADAEAIAQVYNHYVDLGGATFDTVHWTTANVIELLLLQPPETWLVAVQGQGADRRLVGWASARRFSVRHGYRYSLESAIYLRPDAVGNGVADTLQRALIHHCQATAVHHLMARIVAGNDRSIAFHRRYGYQQVGVQKEVGHMQGRWVDVVILQKILDDAV